MAAANLPTTRNGSVIVTGIPGSGKSTISQGLASRVAAGAHLDIDLLYGLVIAGRIEFRQDSPAEDWWQLALARDHVAMLATSFAAHGVFPVVDDVVADRSVLGRYREQLPGPVRLVVLAPSLDVTLQRDASRGKQVAERWAYLATALREALGGTGLWIDSSALDVEATIAAIERRWDEALLA